MPTKARKPPAPSEAEVQRNGITLLKALGWRVWRRNTGGMSGEHKGKRWYVGFGEPGMSDCWGILPDGRHFELEFKRFGKKLTKAQSKWLHTFNTPHTPAFWVDNTATLQRVAEWLNAGGSIRYHVDSDDYAVGFFK